MMLSAIVISTDSWKERRLFNVLETNAFLFQSKQLGSSHLNEFLTHRVKPSTRNSALIAQAITSGITTYGTLKSNYYIFLQLQKFDCWPRICFIGSGLDWRNMLTREQNVNLTNIFSICAHCVRNAPTKDFSLRWWNYWIECVPDIQYLLQGIGFLYTPEVIAVLMSGLHEFAAHQVSVHLYLANSINNMHVAQSAL